ncbi:MAG: DUF6272 family protein [Flavobacteriales bacterium]|nr:DUF6272 family protein [Flavobacteriales bacterium]
MFSGFPSKQNADSNSSLDLAVGQLELQWIGPIGESSIRYILQWLEARLEKTECQSLQKKRLIRLVIELLQNLHHHCHEHSNFTRVQVVSNEGIWTVFSQNAVTSKQQEHLEQRWNHLMSLSPEEWRLLQREKLASGHRSLHGGGGIGLNEILRKADGRVEMTFASVDADIPVVQFIAHIHPKT